MLAGNAQSVVALDHIRAIRQVIKRLVIVINTSAREWFKNGRKI